MVTQRETVLNEPQEVELLERMHKDLRGLRMEEILLRVPPKAEIVQN
jgi:hypothetical protein